MKPYFMILNIFDETLYNIVSLLVDLPGVCALLTTSNSCFYIPEQAFKVKLVQQIWGHSNYLDQSKFLFGFEYQLRTHGGGATSEFTVFI